MSAHRRRGGPRGAFGERGFDRGLEPVRGVQRARDSQPRTRLRSASGRRSSSVARAPRLALLDLAQRLELRVRELQALALALRARAPARARARASRSCARSDSASWRPWSSRSARPSAQPRLEPFLVAPQLLDLLRGSASIASSLSRRRSSNSLRRSSSRSASACDRRLVAGQLDQARVQRLAPALRAGQPLGVVAQLAVAARELGLVRAHALLELGQPRERVAQLGPVARRAAPRARAARPRARRPARTGSRARAARSRCGSRGPGSRCAPCRATRSRATARARGPGARGARSRGRRRRGPRARRGPTPSRAQRPRARLARAPARPSRARSSRARRGARARAARRAASCSGSPWRPGGRARRSGAAARPGCRSRAAGSARSPRSLDSVSLRRWRYFPMPAACSKMIRRSSGFDETSSAIWPCSTIV